MSGSQVCRGSPHGPIEKAKCHLKAEKNKLSPAPNTIVLFAYVYVSSFYSITPLCPSYYVLIL